jgi:hypothetical protein
MGIPVAGFKPEIKKKLREKGFSPSLSNSDVFVGEFNGKQVNLHIVTNNNKVYRIMVADVNPVSEADIKIRFNTLCQQFNANKKYLSLDSIISKYSIPDDENISYEMSINNKRYEAIFYQKTKEYDSLSIESKNLVNKESFTDKDSERFTAILEKMVDDRNYNKVVWFMINELNGEYYITMFYDNKYNQANGEDL